MDPELLRRLDAFANKRYEDRSTAIRQLIDFALRELSQREAFDSYRAGRLTLRELARALGVDLWAAHDLLVAHGVAIAQGDISETRTALNELLQDLTQSKGSRRN